MSDVQYVFVVGLPNIAWIGIVLYLVTHPETAEKWGAIISRLFSGIFRRAERASVSLGIEGRINSFSKSINSEVSGITPERVKIKWELGDITKEAFIRDDQVIVRMNYHKNMDENMVNATLAFVAGGLVHESRPYVDERVMEATSLIYSKKLLEKEQRTALPFFYSEVVGPARRSNQELDKYVEQLQGLDELGYFTVILLSELRDLSAKLHFSLPRDSHKEETRQFVDFLDAKVTKKHPRVDVDPSFQGETISTSIVYVARGEFIGPHLGWIRRCIEGGIATIYICAFGKRNISLVRTLDSKLESNPRLNKVFLKEFRLPWHRGGKEDNICVKYDVCDVDSSLTNTKIKMR